MPEHPNDQHIIPTRGLEHEASRECWCKPQVDEGAAHPSGAKVWIHREVLEHCGDCGAEILGYHRCEGVPGGFGDYEEK